MWKKTRQKMKLSRVPCGFGALPTDVGKNIGFSSSSASIPTFTLRESAYLGRKGARESGDVALCPKQLYDAVFVLCAVVLVCLLMLSSFCALLCQRCVQMSEYFLSLSSAI
jgi:hypothetical protein